MDLYFCYPTWINTIEAFSYFFENNMKQRSLWIYLSKIRNKKSITQKNINWLISIQKSRYSMLLFLRYIKICNSTPNPGWTLFVLRFSSFQAVSKTHCLYANAVVQPSVQHCPCYHGVKDKGSYLISTLPSLYKCTHVKRNKMVARIFWPPLVISCFL